MIKTKTSWLLIGVVLMTMSFVGYFVLARYPISPSTTSISTTTVPGTSPREQACAALRSDFLNGVLRIATVIPGTFTSHFNATMNACIVEVGQLLCLNDGGCWNAKDIYIYDAAQNNYPSLTNFNFDAIAACTDDGRFCYRYNEASSTPIISIAKFKQLEDKYMSE
jgi:hypothetical protein